MSELSLFLQLDLLTQLRSGSWYDPSFSVCRLSRPVSGVILGVKHSLLPLLLSSYALLVNWAAKSCSPFFWHTQNMVGNVLQFAVCM